MPPEIEQQKTKRRSLGTFVRRTFSLSPETDRMLREIVALFNPQGSRNQSSETTDRMIRAVYAALIRNDMINPETAGRIAKSVSEELHHSGMPDVSILPENYKDADTVFFWGNPPVADSTE